MRLAERRARRRAGGGGAVALLRGDGDDVPEVALINLVDLMLVFAVALLLVVGRPGASPAEQAMKVPDPSRMKSTNTPGAGTGERLGVAYRLANGDVVYVPERVGDDHLPLTPASATPGLPR